MMRSGEPLHSGAHAQYVGGPEDPRLIPDTVSNNHQSEIGIC